MNLSNANRRRFLLQAAVITGALPLLGAALNARAALPPLPLDNAQGKALNYAEDAGKVTNSLFKPGSTCENCNFFTAATAACAIFPGFSVAPKGWCSAWALKKA